MKRKRQGLEESPKSPKIPRWEEACHSFENPGFERDWAELSKYTTSEEPGWISGKVFMAWPPRPFVKFMITRLKCDGGEDRETKLELHIKCEEAKHWKIQTSDIYKISLRGAELQEKKGSDKLPPKLIYNDCVALHVLKKPNNPTLIGTVLDVWKMREEHKSINEQREDWFSTPRIEHDPSDEIRSSHNTSPLGTDRPRFVPDHEMSSSVTPPPTTPPDKLSREWTEKSTVGTLDSSEIGSVQRAEEAPEAQQEIVFNQQPQRKSNKKKKKSKRDTRRDPNRGKTGTVKENVNKDTGETEHQEKRLYTDKSMASEDPPVREEIARPIANPLEMVAGFDTQFGPYIALDDVSKEEGKMISVIGVVASVDEVQISRNGDPFISMILIDPSNYMSRGFKVTLFSKNEKMLPAPQKKEIVILRNVKISLWRGAINGTVYPNKLSWATYDHMVGKFSNCAAELVAQALEDRNDLNLDYLHVPKEDEIKYCFDLGEWHRAVEEREEEKKIELPSYERSKTGRARKTVCEMDVNQFFEGIFEILSLTPDDEGGQTLIVMTDYTSHPQISPYGPLGQRALSTSTDRLPEDVRGQMANGTFWLLENIRLKIGSSGSIECDVYSARYRQLKQGENDDDDDFVAFVKRRKEFLAGHDTSRKTDLREYAGFSLISAATAHQYCTLVVEILHVANVHNDVTDLYVTDYTSNTNASTFVPEKLKKSHEYIPVFHVGVYGQRDNLRNIKPGIPYLLKNTYVKLNDKSKLEGKIQTGIGNVTKVNVVLSEGEHFKNFWKRKEEFLLEQQVKNASTLTALASDARVSDVHKPFLKLKEVTRLDLHASSFCISARIVDYFPQSLEDFAIRRCTTASCRKKLPDRLNFCPSCENETYEWIHVLYVRLENEEGNTLMASISGEEANTLLGCSPSDSSKTKSDIDEMKVRLRPIFGGLIDMHDNLGRGNNEVEYPPSRMFTLISWFGLQEGKAQNLFALIDCQNLLNQ